MLILAIVIVLALFILIAGISVVQQSRAYVIERLGAFHEVWGTGMHWRFIFLDRIARKVSLKEQVLDYPPQPVITKDNVTMQIDTVVYFQITDPRLYCYGVEQPMMAMETLTATTLRNIIGDLELDQTLTSRDVINTKMRAILDEATDPWGIKVNRVELKNILPPQDIQNSMEKQMKAERDRRQSILQAEGQKKSAILIAEGEKVYLLGKFGEWAFVQAAAKAGLDVTGAAPDNTGFVRLEDLSAPAGSTHLTAFVNTDKVNLRSRASSTEGQIIGKARTGQRLRVADYGKSWSIVVTPEGKRGYIMTKYLDFE